MTNFKKSNFLLRVILIFAFFLILIYNFVTPFLNNMFSDEYLTIDIKMDQEKCYELEGVDSELCEYNYFPGSYTFTKEEIKNISANENVEKVLFQSFDVEGIFTDGTTEETNTTVTLNQPPLTTPTFPLEKNDSNYTFHSLQFPYEDLLSMGTSITSYNATLNDSVIENTTEYPSVILPRYYADNMNFQQGSVIDLPVFVASENPVVEETTKKYFVTSIYETKNLLPDLQNNIFTDYYPLVEDVNDIDEGALNSYFLTLQSSLMGDSPLHSEYFKDFTTFQKDSDTAITKLHILTNGDSESVYQQLAKDYPYLTIRNHNHLELSFLSFVEQYALVGAAVFVGLFIFLLIIIAIERRKAKGNPSLTELFFQLITYLVIFTAMYFFGLNFMYYYHNFTVPYSFIPFIESIIITIIVLFLFFIFTRGTKEEL